MGSMSSTDKWYADGLKFSCTQCGNCCSGPPGYVWVNAQQRADIAEHLGLDAETFLEDYTQKVGNRYSLIEKSNGTDLDCIFLETRNGKRTCSIYEVRPTQCRTWPFWTENLASRQAWADAGVTCPGIDRGTKHYDFVEIEIQRTRKR